MHTGDMIVNLYLHDRWKKTNYFNTRVIFPSDINRIIDFIKENFPAENEWVMEVKHAVMKDKCIISVLDNEIVGFACYDCIGKGYFGPFGVIKERRNYGIGTELFYECLDQMKFCGYGYAIIGCIDNLTKTFYEKKANAIYIPNSEPINTLYKRRIKTAIEFGDDPFNV